MHSQATLLASYFITATVLVHHSSAIINPNRTYFSSFKRYAPSKEPDSSPTPERAATRSQNATAADTAQATGTIFTASKSALLTQITSVPPLELMPVQNSRACECPGLTRAGPAALSATVDAAVPVLKIKSDTVHEHQDTLSSGICALREPVLLADMFSVVEDLSEEGAVTIESEVTMAVRAIEKQVADSLERLEEFVSRALVLAENSKRLSEETTTVLPVQEEHSDKTRSLLSLHSKASTPETSPYTIPKFFYPWLVPFSLHLTTGRTPGRALASRFARATPGVPDFPILPILDNPPPQVDLDATLLDDEPNPSPSHVKLDASTEPPETRELPKTSEGEVYVPPHKRSSLNGASKLQASRSDSVPVPDIALFSSAGLNQRKFGRSLFVTGKHASKNDFIHQFLEGLRPEKGQDYDINPSFPSVVQYSSRPCVFASSADRDSNWRARGEKAFDDDMFPLPFRAASQPLPSRQQEENTNETLETACSASIGSMHHVASDDIGHLTSQTPCGISWPQPINETSDVIVTELAQEQALESLTKIPERQATPEPQTENSDRPTKTTSCEASSHAPVRSTTPSTSLRSSTPSSASKRIQIDGMNGQAETNVSEKGNVQPAKYKAPRGSAAGAGGSSATPESTRIGAAVRDTVAKVDARLRPRVKSLQKQDSLSGVDKAPWKI
ncbi:hypothetical protein DFH11DRAFT_1741756 [Phellopilus nigrolimitatus]|nr:hypothetical protein DFH11DRAFT_1741756 [Phellopilus nigrolimitatus]